MRKVCQRACVNARQTLFSLASMWGVEGQMSVGGDFNVLGLMETRPIYQLPFAVGVQEPIRGLNKLGGRHFLRNQFNVWPIVFHKTANNVAFFLIPVICFPSASPVKGKGPGVEKVYRWRRFTQKKTTLLGVCLITHLFMAHL